MNCKQTRRRFDDAQDDALDASTRAAFDAHLGGCDGCRAEFDTFCEAVDALDVGPLDATPPEHVAQVMARVHAGEASSDGGAVLVPVRRRRPAPFVVLLSHLAAAAIGGLVVWFLIDTARGAFRATRDAGGQRASGLVADRTVNGQTVNGQTVNGQPGVGRSEDGRSRDDESSGGESRTNEAVDDAAGDGLTAARHSDQTESAFPRIVFLPLQLQVTREVTVLAAPTPPLQRAPLEIDPRIAFERERLRVERRRAAATGTLALAVARTAEALDRIAASTEESERMNRSALELARAEAEAAARTRELVTAQLDAVRSNTAQSSTAGANGADEPQTGPAPERATALATPRAESAVFVERDGDRIRIATDGPTNEVVPALIAMLGDPEQRVRVAVDRRLRAIAEDLGLPTPEELASARGVTAMSDPWWRSQRGQAASAAIAAGDDDADSEELWRAWWSATRSS